MILGGIDLKTVQIIMGHADAETTMRVYANVTKAQAQKVDMGNAKVDIENEKVDIESVLPEKDSNFSVKTTVHIHRLFCECYPNSWPQEMREV